MQYPLFKTIIDTTLEQYACQNCNSKCNEAHLDIQSIHENAVDFDITCPQCQTVAHIHAEIGATHLEKTAHTIVQKMIHKNTKAIKESDIALFEKNLSESGSIEDLLK